MGVQDFNPKVQEAIHRIQPREMTQQAIDWMRELGYRVVNDLLRGAAKVWRLAGQHFVHHAGEGVDVGARGDIPVTRSLLGRHVRVLALDLPGAGQVLGDRGGLGDPEIGDLHPTVGGQEDVVRGDVAVDQPGGRAVGVAQLVGVVQAGGRLHEDALGDAQLGEPIGLARARDQLVDRHAVEERHREEVLAAIAAELVDLDIDEFRRILAFQVKRVLARRRQRTV